MKSFKMVLFSVLFTLAIAEAAFAQKGVVNLNEASVDQIMLLPGVGRTTAERIIAFRKEYGSFKKIEDIMLVKGIGEKKFLSLKPYLAVEGATTLKVKVKLKRGKR